MRTKLAAFLLPLAFLAPTSFSEQIKVKVLVKVGDVPILTSDRDLEYFVRNPTKYRGGTAVNISEREAEELLNRLIVETMIFEENKVVGNVELSAAESLSLMRNFKSAMASRWREFLLSFDQDENSIKERIVRRSVVDRVIEKKIEAVLKVPGAARDKEKSETLAQKAVDDWLKQLRVRYRVQFFE